jgi:nucleotide-binding universal stress UspA family protein
MKILLPVDASACTERLLAHLAAHPELLAGDHEYTLFTAIQPGTTVDTRFVDCGSLEEFVRQQAEAVLAPARAHAHHLGWKVREDYVPGPAAQAIVAKAELLHADLIVMGTHGRSPLGTFVLGSVASAVLEGCKVPVMLIR